jgi:adenylate cyclase
MSGIAVGVACAALLRIPGVQDLEQEVGLRWLFNARGPLAPPDEVVIVAMSRRAAANISLPRDPDKFHRCLDLVVGPTPATHIELPQIPSRWPRCLHTQLVNKLVQAGAGAITFDVLFRERPPLPVGPEDLQRRQDEDLASALASAARVVVAQKLEVIDDHETLSALSPPIANAALGSAPFPLVSDTGRRIDRFPTFTTPTLPTIAVQAHLLDAYTSLSDLLAAHASDIAQLLPPSADTVRVNRHLQATSLLIHRLFRDDAGLASRLLQALDDAQGVDASSVAELRTLVALYGGRDSRLLNFYGPPGTIRIVPYDRVLTATPQTLASLFKARAVFVGYAETDQPEQVEHFATVMSSARGVDLSGVEIAATAFANLLRGESIRPLPLRFWLAIIFLSALVATVVCELLDYRAALLVMAVLLIAYGAVAVQLFSGRELWLPVVFPMLVAAPAAMLSSFGWTYWTARRQREQLRRAFSYFVPREVVSLLEHNAGQIGDAKESLECACVATDAANYTPLAESMSPEQLAEFLNRYYEALFGGVANHGGFVSDVVGDAMVAIWPDRSADTHLRVLSALLEMRDAAERFSEALVGNRLVTRFGADWGPVALTTVGAGAHYEYRAVGNAVNTAARIQELNKKLGTRILVSQPVISVAAQEFALRDLGDFLLRGKSHAVRVYELLARRAQATSSQVELCARFADAIAALRSAQGNDALARFREIHVAFPADPATTYFLRMLEAGVKLRSGALMVD